MMRSHLAVLLCFALLAGQTQGAAAQVVSGRVHAAPVVSGAAGAAVRPVNLTSGLNITGSQLTPLAGVLPNAGVLPTVSALPSVQAQAQVLQAQPAAAAVPAAAASPIQVLPASQQIAPKAAPSAASEAPGAAVQAVHPAAAQTDEAQAVQAETKGRGLLAALMRALRGEKTAELFQGGRRGQGFVPTAEPTEVDGVQLDPKPTLPQASTALSRASLPGRRQSLLSRLFGRSQAESIDLPGAPQDVAGIEAALRKFVSENPAQFGGISVDSLYTVMAKKVAGKAGLADVVYVSFRQQHNAVPIEGSDLTFTVKLFNGRTTIVHTAAQLYQDVTVDTDGKLSETDVLAKAASRLGNLPNAAEDLLDLGSKIMHLGGQWRAVSLRMSKALSLVVAVDLNTGEAFAWDPRMHVETEPAKQAPVDLPGTAVGRGVADGPMKEGVEPDVLPLGHVEIKTDDGKTYYADAEGKFTVQGEGDKPVTLSVRLNGKFARVNDRSGQALVVTVVAKPGEELRVVFNPAGAAETALAQVNAYAHVTRIHDWLLEQGIDLEAFKRPLPIVTNIDDECNAYYTPYNPSLNFFKSSERCANSSYNDVIYHEYGHYVDDKAHGGIPNGGLSEGWGDIFSMLLTKQPVLGRGFLKGQAQDYIRHGENTYQYHSSDEVHDQGQAWGGFGWKLRKALVASLGEAEGAALASALVVPVMLASVRDIPKAIEAVLMRDVDQDGETPHFKEIAAAAKAHGITVKKPKPGLSEPLVTVDGDGPMGQMVRAIARTARALANVSRTQVRAVSTAASAKGMTLAAAPAKEIPADAQVKAKVPFTAGALIRGQVRREIQRFCDYHGLQYELKEYKGLLESDFLLTVEGPYSTLKQLTDWLQSLAN